MHDNKFLSEKQIKEKSVEILDAVDNFCKLNGIKYSLFFGSLLGAVRHKGFIPWDDDIDIVMDRDNYLKFINSFSNENYAVMDTRNKYYYLPFAKVYDKNTIKKEHVYVSDRFEIGLNIDLYVLDKIPSEKTFLKTSKKIRRINKFRVISCYPKDLRKTLIKKMVCPLFRNRANYFCRRMNNIAKKYNNSECAYSFSVAYQKNYGPFLNNLLKEYITIQFEGREYSCFKNYDYLLRNLYGDYMKLPPESERVPNHDFVVFYKNN